MPPYLALFLAAVFIAWLFWRESRERPRVTRALWIPTAWMVILCSRTVAQWLSLFGLPGGEGSDAEGSPVDAVIFFLLIIAGAMVLRQRQIQLGEVFQHNRWLIIFLAYCLVSVVWADSPFISVKRWIKILGHPIMTLIILTEPDREEAFTVLMKRCGYIFVPLSIVFIKYFPAWGRGFDGWSGLPSNFGVTTNKNILGCVCFILGAFFFWQFLRVRNWEKDRRRRNELLLCIAFLGMIGWLVHMAQSQTSFVSLAITIGVMLLLGFRFINLQYVTAYFIVGSIVLIAANSLFGLTDMAIAALGRNPTLTDRTVIWHEVLKIEINPVLGTGFESFWSGDRQDRLTAIFFWRPNQAHNGYLETYLNLGLVGLAMMLILMFTAFQRGARSLLTHYDFGRFRVAFLVAFTFYNWTEAAFKALHPAWFVFFIILMEFPNPAYDLPQESDPQAAGMEGTIELDPV